MILALQQIQELLEHKKEKMKGIIFNEFLEMVEEKFGYEMSDKIIDLEKFDSGGVYSAVGTYDFSELQFMITKLSSETGTSPNQLIYKFGLHLSNKFHQNYKTFFDRSKNFFDFIESIESIIHVEVKKLYPDASLPSFEYVKRDEKVITMIYRSDKKLYTLAEGLIMGCAKIYNEDIKLFTEIIQKDGSVVRFDIARKEN